MKLFGSPISQATLRVQLAAALKGIKLDVVEVDVVGNAHHGATYTALNPTNLIPTLVDGPDVLGQSVAILEYLEEKVPEPALLPREIMARARARAMIHHLCSDIAPLGSLRVVRYLASDWQADSDRQRQWRAHWYETGLSRLETLAQEERGDQPFLFGAAPGLVECCLASTLYAARRFGLKVNGYPTLLALETALYDRPGLRHLKQPIV